MTEVRVRVRENRWTMTGIGLIGVLGLTAEVHGTTGGGLPGIWGFAYPSLLPAVGALVFTVRAFRAGVIVRDDVIVIRNVFWSKVLRREDVASVRMGEYRFGFGKVCEVWTRENRRYPVSNISPPSATIRPNSKASYQAMDCLRQALNDGAGHGQGMNRDSDSGN